MSVIACSRRGVGLGSSIRSGWVELGGLSWHSSTGNTSPMVVLGVRREPVGLGSISSGRISDLVARGVARIDVVGCCVLKSLRLSLAVVRAGIDFLLLG